MSANDSALEEGAANRRNVVEVDELGGKFASPNWKVNAGYRRRYARR